MAKDWGVAKAGGKERGMRTWARAQVRIWTEQGLVVSGERFGCDEGQGWRAGGGTFKSSSLLPDVR